MICSLDKQRCVSARSINAEVTIEIAGLSGYVKEVREGLAARGVQRHASMLRRTTHRQKVPAQGVFAVLAHEWLLRKQVKL